MSVTVVIPTRDRRNRVLAAAHSVLAQTFADFELIVVDDGSADGTAEALAGVRDARLRVLRASGRGVSAARNLGIEAGTGGFIALLDSDDLWLPDKLAKHLDFAAQHGFHASQTEETWVRHGRFANPRELHKKPSGRFFEQALKLCLVSPSCVLFTRDIWRRRGPFDESLPACEDYDLWLRFLVTDDIGLLPKALTVKHGGHGDQLSRLIVGLDLLRATSLLKLLSDPLLEPWQRTCIFDELKRKAGRHAAGCQKRGRLDEAAHALDLVSQARAKVLA